MNVFKYTKDNAKVKYILPHQILEKFGSNSKEGHR